MGAEGVRKEKERMERGREREKERIVIHLPQALLSLPSEKETL